VGGVSVDPLLIDTDQARFYGLTYRQMEVLARAAAGMTNAQIGRDLYLTADAVKKHLKRVFELLQVPDRASAVAQAYELEVFRTRAQRAEMSTPVRAVA
jgi:DNA-binding CsgD family transcriptional regulator